MIEDVSFEILSKCVNNCLHCSSCSTFNSKEIISLSKIKEVVDNLIHLHVKRICLSGGEPFLHPDLIEIVQYISGHGIICDIYSAGIIKSSDGLSALSKNNLYNLKLAGVHRIMFNFQSLNENIYNLIMGTTNCQPLLIESIDNTVACDIEAELHFVPMKYNINEIEGVLSFAEDHNIQQVSFLKLVEHGRAKVNSLALSKDEELLLMQKLKRLKNQNKKIRIGIPLDNECEKCSCHAVKNKVYIKYDGSVYGCEAFKYIEFEKARVSNIYNENIIDIINNSEYIAQSKALICKYSNGYKGCPVQNYLEELRRKK